MFKLIKRAIKGLVWILVVALMAMTAVNFFVIAYSAQYMLEPEEAAALTDVDCIVTLGCSVKPGGQPSNMLADRLETAVDLYEAGVSARILMSGDHGSQYYNEVSSMKQYALDRGVPSEAVFMDHAGFSTYESMYRTRDIFEAEKIVVVTQGYHMYRALYIARKLGMEAYGVPSDQHRYAGQAYRSAREYLARNKDVLTVFLQPKPTYLGDAIPVGGNGDLTND